MPKHVKGGGDLGVAVFAGAAQRGVHGVLDRRGAESGLGDAQSLLVLVDQVLGHKSSIYAA